MKRAHGIWLLAAVMVLLVACGPVRKSVFPPLVTVQQVHLDGSGHWQMQLRIQNNSYQDVRFTGLALDMTVHGAAAGRIDSAINLDIPPLSVDIAKVRMTPSAGAARILASGSNEVPYRLTGTATGTPEQGSKNRVFKVDSGTEHALSPTPGLPNTWR